MTKVVIQIPLDPAPVRAALEAVADCEAIIARDADEARRLLPGAEGLVVGGAGYRDLHPHLHEAGPGLKWIQFSASGFDMLDELPPPKGLVVMRAVGVWGQSVAGHAMAMLLALLRRLPAAEASRQNRNWDRPAIATGLRSMAGRRVLLAGFGDIGQTFGAAASALGADLRVVARRARHDAGSVPVQPLSALDRMLPEADVLVIALPFNSETENLFDSRRLGLLPRGAIVINVGRGELVDEAALAAALHDGSLGGAGLDVFVREPLPTGSPLWDAPNTIITPHIGAMGDPGSLKRLGALCAANLEKLRRSDVPVGLITPHQGQGQAPTTTNGG